MIGKVFKRVLRLRRLKKIFRSPFDGIKCIRMLNNDDDIAFVITSVIHPINVSFNPARLHDTFKTIESVRRYCPNAYVIFSEGGRYIDELDSIRKIVDLFVYCGTSRKAGKYITARNKGIGEAYLMRQVFSEIKKHAFTFKISGRYALTEDFDVSHFATCALNFKNYVFCDRTADDKEISGLFGYVEGSHSTRLYGVPQKYYGLWSSAMSLSIPFMRRGHSLEWILPSLMEDCLFYYHERIGVTGDIAASGNIITE